ncbi:MAG TPA: ferredoxin--NADP reductase [Streptosporangiaceae bacterium]|nr:ferredoxin--NADP reductase [Streptosporangiaceae bacterium]
MSARRTFYQVPVAAVIAETEQASSFVLAVPGELAQAFAYRAGQFITVRVPAPDGASVARCYSLSSSPVAGEPACFTVKRMPSGYASNWIIEHVMAGTVLDVLPPAGTFTPRSLDSDLLLIAAGSGITPVMSILKSALRAGRGRIALVYANADERSVIFAPALRDLQALAPHRLVIVHWLDAVQGPPTASALRELFRPYAGHEAFVCGPDPYMATARQALGELGVPAPRVHVERFVSLAENPFEAEPDAGGIAAVLEVALGERTRKLDWPAGLRMLDVLIGAGLDAPYSCREGVCGACACRLIRGEVEMAHNEVLEVRDLAEGYVLACQSIALTSEVSVDYS